MRLTRRSLLGLLPFAPAAAALVGKATVRPQCWYWIEAGGSQWSLLSHEKLRYLEPVFVQTDGTVGRGGEVFVGYALCPA